MNWSAYEERLFVNGVSPRDRNVNKSRAKFERDIDKDPSFKSGTKVIRSGDIVGEISIRMDTRKLVNEVPEMKIYDVLNNTTKFRRGDILQVITDEDGIVKNDFWLCFEEDNFHGIQHNGKVELCNFPLRWQDEDDLSIIEEWCVVSRYKTSSTGKDDGKVVTVDNTRRNILIPYNDRTAKLAQGKRFFIDVQGLNNCKTYELTDLDRTSYIYNGIGCFQLVCAEDVKLEGDREDLMICDYKDIPEPPTPSIGYCEITYSGEPVIKVGGSPKRFTAIFKDNDGNTIDSIDPQWEIIADPEIVNKIVISSALGNEINIGTDDSTLIGAVFILKVIGEDSIYGLFNCEVNISIEGLW